MFRIIGNLFFIEYIRIHHASSCDRKRSTPRERSKPSCSPILLRSRRRCVTRCGRWGGAWGLGRCGRWASWAWGLGRWASWAWSWVGNLAGFAGHLHTAAHTATHLLQFAVRELEILGVEHTAKAAVSGSALNQNKQSCNLHS